MNAFLRIGAGIARCAGCCALCCGVAGAYAQASDAGKDYPLKPIRLIVPTAPGGGVDLLARMAGQHLAAVWGQQVVVDNRPGAGGNIGTDLVAKSAADGYTLLMSPAGLSISAAVYRKLPYDAVRDLAPVTIVASTPYALLVHPSLPVKSVQELVALARSKPGMLNYASAGSGTASHLAGELLKSMARIDLTHVPYKGIGPAVTDLLGGQVSILIGGLPAALPYIKTGRLRALAVANAKRSTLMPELPTIAETGLKGYEVENWIGMLAPAATPPDIIARLHAEIVRLLGAAETRERLSKQGFETVGDTPQHFAALIKAEIAKWTKVVTVAGITAD